MNINENEEIKIEPFSDKLESSMVVSSKELGRTRFDYTIEKYSTRKFLRYKIHPVEETYRVDFDLMEMNKLDLDSYFRNVVKIIVSQIMEMKSGKFDSTIHKEDLKFLKTFEKIFDKIHTTGTY